MNTLNHIKLLITFQVSKSGLKRKPRNNNSYFFFMFQLLGINHCGWYGGNKIFKTLFEVFKTPEDPVLLQPPPLTK